MLEHFEDHIENLKLLETDFVKLLTYTLAPGYSSSYRSFHAPRFCTLLEGRKDIIINGKPYSYYKHQSILMPPHSQVITDIQVPTKVLVFELSTELIRHVAQQIHQQIDAIDYEDHPDLIVNHSQLQMAELMHQITKTINQPEPPDHYLVDLYAKQIIYHLLKSESTGGLLLRQTRNPMERAIYYMNSHLDEPYDGSAIADLMHMSGSNLSHSFKQYVGMSPSKYMHHLKMAKAKDLLRHMTVTNTAFELGYDNPSYFIRKFKNHFGITPKQFQLLL